MKPEQHEVEKSEEQFKGWRYLSDEEIDEILTAHSMTMRAASRDFKDKEELTSIVSSLRKRMRQLKRINAPEDERRRISKALTHFSSYLLFFDYNSEELLSNPPQLGERILLLILKKEERVNIPGDLAEEYKEITAKHGTRFATIWYYKQVVASAWPLIRKAFRWSLLAWVEELIRRRV